MAYFAGDDAKDILSAFALTDTEKRKFEVVSVLRELFRWQTKHDLWKSKVPSQEMGAWEFIERFVTSLYHFTTHYGYNALKEKLISDCFVVGLQDSSLSEKLQSDFNLTLEAAYTQIRQKNVVHCKLKA